MMFDDDDKKALMAKSLEANMNKARKNSSSLQVTPEERVEAEIDEDYILARDTYKEVMVTGTKAIKKLSNIATETEHPRAFEVLSKSIKDVADVADKLMKLQKEKAKVKGEGTSGKKVTNNNVFIGSTTDLQRMLIDSDKGEIIDQDDK